MYYLYPVEIPPWYIKVCIFFLEIFAYPVSCEVRCVDMKVHQPHSLTIRLKWNVMQRLPLISGHMTRDRSKNEMERGRGVEIETTDKIRYMYSIEYLYPVVSHKTNIYYLVKN